MKFENWFHDGDVGLGARLVPKSNRVPPAGRRGLDRQEAGQLAVPDLPACGGQGVPDGGQHSPDHSRFVAWQLDQALAARASWDTDRDLPASVNLAFRCLLDPAFPTQVAGVLERAGVPGHQLMFEFGETGSLTGGVRVGEVLTTLRRLGVRVAVDRFGGGTSSLTGLLKLPATHLKIDPEFIHDALDSEQVAVVRLAVELGRQSDLTVIALGVPSEEHVEALVKLGCDAAQGRHLMPPVAPRIISNYLAAAPPLPLPDADVIQLESRRRDPNI